MSAASSASPTAPERELLEAARKGSESAFRDLVEPRQSELRAHCYRMLGSVHDAEDALQDAMLRAWKGLKTFDGRGPIRPWLYRIATNTCLDIIGKRPKRVLPVDYGPRTDPHDGPGDPIWETVWVDPYPDELLVVEDGLAGPEASYDQREGIELAFIAALQHLPANQRAALILREVLGFSAKECAATLDTSVPSINSALQRARKTLEDKLPDKTQQETLRTLGDDEVTALVDRYVDAWQRDDVDTVVAMLTEDSTFAMPPMSSWFGGRDEIEVFLRGWPMSGQWRWKPLRVRANGQPALAFYAWDDDAQAYLPFALNVLSFREDRISDVCAFIARVSDSDDRAVMARMPEQPFDPERMQSAFGAFGLPERID